MNTQSFPWGCAIYQDRRIVERHSLLRRNVSLDSPDTRPRPQTNRACATLALSYSRHFLERCPAQLGKGMQAPWLNHESAVRESVDGKGSYAAEEDIALG